MEKLIAPKSNPKWLARLATISKIFAPNRTQMAWLVCLISQRPFAPKIAVALSECARQVSMRVFYRIGKPRGHDEWSPSGVIWAVEQLDAFV